jgi:hypothetical protein
MSKIGVAMAPREKRLGVIMNGKVTDSHSTVAKDAKIEGEHYCKERINVDKNGINEFTR